MLKTEGKIFAEIVSSELEQVGLLDAVEVNTMTYTSKRTRAYTGWGIQIEEKNSGRILSSTEFSQTCDPESWKAKRIIRKVVKKARKVISL